MAANDDSDGGWRLATSPFDPQAARVSLERQLRELRPLVARGEGFALRGRAVVALALSGDGKAIDARLAVRPALVPEWTVHRLASASELRRFVGLVQAALRRWDEDD